jgi:imidazolonepropionase
MRFRNDRIEWIGASARDARAGKGDTIDAPRRARPRPVLVDCHTHLVYAGDRSNEFEKASQGRELRRHDRAVAGHRVSPCAPRVARAARSCGGNRRSVSTPFFAEVSPPSEIKSGYGLDTGERAQVPAVARSLGDGRARVVTTLLAPRIAVPPEFAGRADDVRRPGSAPRSFRPWLRERLADAVDAFCEGIRVLAVADTRASSNARARRRTCV